MKMCMWLLLFFPALAHTQSIPFNGKLVRVGQAMETVFSELSSDFDIQQTSPEGGSFPATWSIRVRAAVGSRQDAFPARQGGTIDSRNGVVVGFRVTEVYDDKSKGLKRIAELYEHIRQASRAPCVTEMRFLNPSAFSSVSELDAYDTVCGVYSLRHEMMGSLPLMSVTLWLNDR